MSYLRKFRWRVIGILGKVILWLWAKSTRMKVEGEEEYKKLRDEKKPIIFLVWHGRIFIVPYFFRRRKIMPLVSPSQDGEIAAQIMARWGYRILRGSSSHSIIKAWNEMKRELQRGGEIVIVPDGPKGPDRKLKPGCLKLSQETGASLIPFSFSTSRKKFLKSWDKFLLFYPFSKVIAIYGKPLVLDSNLKDDELEDERQKLESLMVRLEEEADGYFRSNQ